MAIAKPRVCVTGASGFIGTYVAKELLSRGYQVIGTVRDASDPAKVEHLTALGDGLTLLSADLTRDGAFDEACTGCDAVIHTASSVALTAKDPQRDIVDVAVEGTLNVLRSAARAGVRRVIQTSSMAAVVDAERPDGHVFTEDDWNDSITIADPYGLSKVKAERAARQFCDELPDDQRFELVAINPSFVLGPVLARVHLRTSPSLIRDLLRGAFPMAPDLSMGEVDVRDVATAHVHALEHHSPSPRYLCNNVSVTVPEMARLLRELFPESRAPRRTAPNWLMYGAALIDKRLTFSFLRRNLGRRRTLNSDLIREELGVSFRPLEASVRETAQSIIDRGWLHRSRR